VVQPTSCTKTPNPAPDAGRSANKSPGGASYDPRAPATIHCVAIPRARARRMDRVLCGWSRRQIDAAARARRHHPTPGSARPRRVHIPAPRTQDAGIALGRVHAGPKYVHPRPVIIKVRVSVRGEHDAKASKGAPSPLSRQYAGKAWLLGLYGVNFLAGRDASPPRRVRHLPYLTLIVGTCYCITNAKSVRWRV
jgi:hypothetical protein